MQKKLLEKELSTLKIEYDTLLRKHMVGGIIYMDDELVKDQVVKLKLQIATIQKRISELVYSELSDEEKNNSRLNHIQLAEKFYDEGMNQKRVVYMRLYLEFVNFVAKLVSKNRPEYSELFEYLNGSDFIYTFEKKYNDFCLEHQDLTEIYRKLILANPFEKDSNN